MRSHSAVPFSLDYFPISIGSYLFSLVSFIMRLQIEDFAIRQRVAEKGVGYLLCFCIYLQYNKISISNHLDLLNRKWGYAHPFFEGFSCNSPIIIRRYSCSFCIRSRHSQRSRRLQEWAWALDTRRRLFHSHT